MAARRVQEPRIRDTGLWGGLFAIGALLLLLGAGPGAISDIPEFGTFIDEIASRHGFERDELAAVFAKARLQPAVLKAMSQPAEKKPWHFYRELFINDKRISDGAKFMHLNAETLLEARKAYGIPPEMTTAILGVETGYGKRTGRYLVLDTLATLAFNYPPRAKLFRHELEHYLLLIREEDIRPRSMKGSYAGAMGIAQFMPSSYRRYAVDFDGDGKRDLTRNVQDAIGSVGNYFKEHGWKADAPVTVRARITVDANRLWLERGSRIRRRVDEWTELGAEPVEPLAGHWQATLIVLEGKSGPEHWFGFHNFHVITEYNHSTNYAMAVYQLSQDVEALRQKNLTAAN